MNPVMRRARWVYGLGALSNFAVTLPAFFAYHWYVDLFTTTRPNYPFLVWIWSGMAFLWGVSFVEIALDPIRAYPLVKYSWLEKSITSASVIVAFAIGDVPGKFLAGVCLTDVMWIPLFIWVHVGLAALRRAHERSTDGTTV
ncbi:MAG TPA: hypothetical protein VN636_19465 [Acidimicrobiia bacterium]|nr:hypothetical protein [Acidimicrobiia bacterium]